jgi:hypothetical protein
MSSKNLDVLGTFSPSFAEQLYMSMSKDREYKTANPTLAMFGVPEFDSGQRKMHV